MDVTRYPHPPVPTYLEVYECSFDRPLPELAFKVLGNRETIPLGEPLLTGLF
jgi:hypothetical protein